MRPRYDDPVVVVRDGRQFEGTLGPYDHRYVVDGVPFHQWEADEILTDESLGASAKKSARQSFASAVDCRSGNGGF